MSYMTVGGVIEDLKKLYEQAKPLYEQVKPAVKQAYEGYKGEKDNTEAVLPANSPTVAEDVPAEGGTPPSATKTNWMLYAGIGLAILVGASLLRSR